jgi:hypothetical protein
LGPMDAFQLRHLQLTWLDFLLILGLQYSITVSFGFVILAENPAWESFLELQYCTRERLFLSPCVWSTQPHKGTCISPERAACVSPQFHPPLVPCGNSTRASSNSPSLITTSRGPLISFSSPDCKSAKLIRRSGILGKFWNLVWNCHRHGSRRCNVTGSIE